MNKNVNEYIAAYTSVWARLRLYEYLDILGPERVLYCDTDSIIYIEDEFTKEGRFSRGVKQRNEKGIWVLQATGMPSILVETGYISNTEEEQYINSDKGQDEIVAAIVNAIKRYKASLEGNSPATSSSNNK